MNRGNIILCLQKINEELGYVQCVTSNFDYEYKIVSELIDRIDENFDIEDERIYLKVLGMFSLNELFLAKLRYTNLVGNEIRNKNKICEHLKELNNSIRMYIFDEMDYKELLVVSRFCESKMKQYNLYPNDDELNDFFNDDDNNEFDYDAHEMYHCYE